MDKYKATREELELAVDQLELAIISLGIPDLVRGWGEPRHRNELGVKLPTDAGTIYEVYDAWKLANAIVNR